MAQDFSTEANNDQAQHSRGNSPPLPLREVAKTKISIPPPRVRYVPRPALVELLMPCEGRKLTLLSAATGAGKTTLLSLWAHQRACSVAWVRLGEVDNDPQHFWLPCLPRWKRSTRA